MPSALDRRSAAARVAAVVRERIAEGTLAPGSRIVEADLAIELEVSRSPVREALLALRQEGLIAIIPYRGAIVTPLQPQRLAELTDFRLALERFALDRVILRASARDSLTLRRQLGALRAAVRSGSRRRAIDADLAVHRTLIELAENSLLTHAYENLLTQIRLYIDVTSARYARLEELAQEHDALIAAIERRATAAARKLLDAHILHGLEPGTSRGRKPDSKHRTSVRVGKPRR